MLKRTALLLRTITGASGLLALAVMANIAVSDAAPATRWIAGAAVLPAAAVVWLAYLKDHPLPAIGLADADSHAAIRQVIAHVDLRLANLPLTDAIDVPMVIFSHAEYTRAVAQRDERGLGKPASWDAMVAHFAEDPRCTLIVGPAGSGKTTVMLSLARTLLKIARREERCHIPLPLSLQKWKPDGGGFDVWVTRRVRGQLGIPTFVTASWLRRGSAVLFLDGLDHVEPRHLRACIEEIRDWTTSARGTKVVVACRTETARFASTLLPFDSVAALQPIPAGAVERYVPNWPAKVRAHRSVAASGLLELAKPDEQLYDDLHRPFFLEVLARSLSTAAPAGHSGDDAGWTAFTLGNRLAEQDDVDGAIEAYRRAMESKRSSWRAPAAVRLSLLHVDRGDIEGARTALTQAVSYSLEPSFVGGSRWDTESLTPDETRVLRSMEHGRSYDEAQVSSRSLVPPSGSARAIRDLRLRGLVELVDDGLGNARFARR